MPESVSPVVKGLEPYEYVLAESQPEYSKLVVLRGKGPSYTMVSRWTFTDAEREAIAAGAEILVGQMTFGHMYQPTFVQGIIGQPCTPEELSNIVETFGLNDELDERLSKNLLDKS